MHGVISIRTWSGKLALSISMAVASLGAISHAAPVDSTRIDLAYIERLPRMPQPLVMRDWLLTSRYYYNFVFDESKTGYHLPVLGFSASRATFGFPGYVNGTAPGSGEAMACVAPVIGGLLSGMDMTRLNGYDFVKASKHWYDSRLGLYRDRPGQHDSLVDAGIYGYWPAMLGIMLGSFYPDDATFRAQFTTTVKRFREIAEGSGCPDKPDFKNYGYDFAKPGPSLKARFPGDRVEPMNRLGNASSVAWINFVGFTELGDSANLSAAECALAWHIAHPGRYEVTHLPGPLVAARLNAEFGRSYDLTRMLRTWMGDCPDTLCAWKVTAGTVNGGLTTDGLDAGWIGGEDKDFYAFTMGTLQGPAWLVPVARYEPAYARAIGKYALHAANSARLLQGYGMDWNHQDHKDWKDANDPLKLLFYEGLVSRDWGGGGFRPYATGDPMHYGWGYDPLPDSIYLAQKSARLSEESGNLALYMGNHVGFLGGILSATGTEGLLKWDCLKTDYYHAPAFPTSLYYNPYDTITQTDLDAGSVARDLYDAVTHAYLAKGKTGKVRIGIPVDGARVVVVLPSGLPVTRQGRKLSVDGKVFDYHAPQDGSIALAPMEAARPVKTAARELSDVSGRLASPEKKASSHRSLVLIPADR